MLENLMNKDHKATNDAYREGYDRIFGKNSRKTLDVIDDNGWSWKPSESGQGWMWTQDTNTDEK